MLLRDYCAEYVSCRDISRDRVKQLNWTVDRFERFLMRPPMLADLTDEVVNRWIDSLLNSGLARRTVHSQRGNLLSLWLAAFADRRLDCAPTRIKKVSRPRLIPSAEPPEKVAGLLLVAQREKGCFRRSKVSRAAFWTAFIVFLWETGLRLKDMLRVEWDNVADGVLVLSQSKTGWPIIRPLSANCMMAIEAIEPRSRQRIFGDALSRGHVIKGFRRLAKAAGFRGGTKRVRKSGATAVEMATPGAAKDYLGHRTSDMAYQYYVDPVLLQRSSPSPPPLPKLAGE